MPQLVYPIDPNGLLVDVLVGLRGLTIASLTATGQPIPAPLRARGAIDTGTDLVAFSGSAREMSGSVAETLSKPASTLEKAACQAVRQLAGSAPGGAIRASIQRVTVFSSPGRDPPKPGLALAWARTVPEGAGPSATGPR